MAKKKKQQEPKASVALILVLVFFIIATLALGYTTYNFYDEAEQERAKTKTAIEEKKVADSKYVEETIRRGILRTAIGVESEIDRQDLSSHVEDEAKRAIMLEEVKLLTDKLSGALPGTNAFAWPLIALKSGKAIEGVAPPTAPHPQPQNTIPALVIAWRNQAKNLEAKLAAESKARKTAEDQKAAAEDARAKAEDAFKKSLDDLGLARDKKFADLDTKFAALKSTADLKAGDFKKLADEWAEARKSANDEIDALNKRITDLVRKNDALKNPDASDLEERYKRLNIVKLEERKGVVDGKEGNFITIRFGSRLNLLPNQSFVVISPTGSLVEVMEREKALDKQNSRYGGLDRREPFAENEMLKGTIEIVEVTGQYSARCRITSEAQPIRNPISKEDQVFNVVLAAATKENVAFCGVIDLDGDGRHNNQEFIRILEKNNVIIDEYLDLETGELKKRLGGMSLRTKFLVVGTDAPDVGQIRKMKERARELGIQLIDARKFLMLIGVRPPKNPAPAYYGGSNLGTAEAKEEVPMPMPPKEEPPAKKP